jgi:small subunit ribosomal protein S9
MAEEEQNEETPETPEETEATPPETDPEVSEDAEPAAPSEETPEAQDDQPEPEAPSEEPEAQDDQPASEPEAQSDQPATEPEAQSNQPDSDPDAPGREAEEASGGDVSEADDSGEGGGEAAPAAGSDVKAKDKPPGADLEPIAIEDEKELTAEERARKEAEAEERARAEEAATSDASEEPAARRKAAEVPADARIQATGKRKSAIARVVLTSGSGEIKINNRELDVYFPRAHDQSVARQALVTAGYESSVDISVRVHGGGVSGQAGAVRHGIARALTEIEPELRRDLKRRGLLTRDAREKERRKAGLKKARKKPQFSKR